MLGDLYLYGEGVPQDYSQAYFWLDLAAANPPRMDSGIPPEAAKLFGKAQKGMAQALISDRDEAASHLTRTELFQVQEQVERWVESHKAKSHAQ
jgi:hypothetical protein